MTLIPDWRTVLRKAWSVRLMIVSAGLSGLEVAVPYLAPQVPSGLFAIFAAMVSAGAIAARAMAQKSITK